ncbi:MAG: imidazolonepropionase [Elusimicrobia bacterium]|nr:imidazolonepropionase [Elusimicrobiota bacterium]
MALILTNIKQLLTFKGAPGPRSGSAMRDIGLITNGAVLIEGGHILASGPEKDVIKHPLVKKAREIKARGVVIPAFVDSHTHAVFAEPRLKDFSMRLEGASYKEIKAAGGGIVSSIASVRKQNPRAMAGQLLKRAQKFLECGTGTIEVKSGYGLSLASELKMLRAVKNAGRETALEMIPTLLAAHSVPPEFKGDAEKYLAYTIEKIMPAVAKEKLAVFADIFCEKGYFSPAQTACYLEAAKSFGLKPKAHTEQLSNYGGTLAAAHAGAVSVDHADFINAADIKALKASGTIVTLLPASNHYLGVEKYPPVKALMAAGIPVALATDFNPGTAPCWNMQFVLSLACLRLKMGPEEALTAATVNGACALGLGGRLGTLEAGKQADLAVFDAEDYRELCYYFGGSLNLMTVKKGRALRFKTSAEALKR